mmetsp:Transcript_44979/g.73300  ORF Transcript_44979/g.73300 Transcript_44979/m.73300 type:complete len:218 (-) Transcript_44979:2636-3289(-)
MLPWTRDWWSLDTPAAELFRQHPPLVPHPSPPRLASVALHHPWIITMPTTLFLLPPATADILHPLYLPYNNLVPPWSCAVPLLLFTNGTLSITTIMLLMRYWRSTSLKKILLLPIAMSSWLKKEEGEEEGWFLRTGKPRYRSRWRHWNGWRSSLRSIARPWGKRRAPLRGPSQRHHHHPQCLTLYCHCHHYLVHPHPTPCKLAWLSWSRRGEGWRKA